MFHYNFSKCELIYSNRVNRLRERNWQKHPPKTWVQSGIRQFFGLLSSSLYPYQSETADTESFVFKHNQFQTPSFSCIKLVQNMLSSRRHAKMWLHAEVAEKPVQCRLFRLIRTIWLTNSIFVGHTGVQQTKELPLSVSTHVFDGRNWMIRFVSNTPIQIYSWCPSASVMPIGFYRAMHFSPKRGHAITNHRRCLPNSPKLGFRLGLGLG